MASAERGPGRERGRDGGQGETASHGDAHRRVPRGLRRVCMCVHTPQPIPHRRDERPVSCFVTGTAPPMQPNLAALARDAACLARDKQRPSVPSVMISNETYGTVLDLLPPPGPTPPLPPRGPSRGDPSFSPASQRPCDPLTSSDFFPSGQHQPVTMETIGRQRSSSDPPIPHTPETNSSVYGECNFLLARSPASSCLTIPPPHTHLQCSQLLLRPPRSTRGPACWTPRPCRPETPPSPLCPRLLSPQ